MLLLLLQLFLFFISGIIQEACIASYHRCAVSDRILQTATLSTIITIISLLVITEVIKKILDSSLGYVSLVYVFVFALGKGVGAYITLRMWKKYDNSGDRTSSK